MLLLLQFCANLEQLQLYKSTIQIYICIYIYYTHIYTHTYAYVIYIHFICLSISLQSLTVFSPLLLLFIFVLFNICLTFVAPFPPHSAPLLPAACTSACYYCVFITFIVAHSLKFCSSFILGLLSLFIARRESICFGIPRADRASNLCTSHRFTHVLLSQ